MKLTDQQWDKFLNALMGIIFLLALILLIKMWIGGG